MRAGGGREMSGRCCGVMNGEWGGRASFVVGWGCEVLKRAFSGRWSYA